jgi:aspartyl-tRNA(Asn)/glutamyl-tRNA(Gln) amidotransferase subunit C
MPINPEAVAKIAKLAGLKIPVEEQVSVAGELSKILDWVAQLDEVDVTDVEPLMNVNDGSLRMRPDIINDGDKAADILANAPAKTADFFTVPKVIE